MPRAAPFYANRVIFMSLIDPQLKAILVCPTCHGDLEEDEAKAVLRCQNDGTEFPVRDGIPIMLVEDTKPTGGG
jgi:uncharacterized protein YbaR (Trm112 family)